MALTKKRALKAIALAGGILASCASHAFSLEGTLWTKVQSKVDPYLLYAIALAESQKASGPVVRPWPWAVNVAGKGYYFSDLRAAEEFVDAQLDKGITNMDIGPLQVNVLWHGFRVSDPKELFHLPTAIKVGADILSEALASSPNDQTLAVGRYHNWTDERRARAYGTKVLSYRNMMVQAGR
jgi:hypothetical protein